ncbi:hypothetical protein AnigIFM63604_007181 [Aspergillus niger]|uniref:Uncharacterized protein n=1 Tax=Aspergillus niger TaxID=5061 RepID=A0A9W6EC14_ASPNG|nr:hypothetical protein AnigIFM63604_007181 [Aspergillus niger]
MSKRRISETISPSSPDLSPVPAQSPAPAPAPAPKRRRMRRQRHSQYLSIDPPSPEDYYPSSPITPTTPVSSPIPPAPSSPPPPPPPRRTPRYRHILPKPPPTSTSPTKPTPQPHSQKKTPSSKIHPHLPLILAHFRTPLYPLVSSTTGHQHPDFPRSLLQYNLLTSEQLDRLAVHFHQVDPPVRGTFWYPVRIVQPWIRREGAKGYVADEEVGLEVKRRRFGRFIGLRGCEEILPAGSSKRRRGKGVVREREEEVEEGEIREEEEEYGEEEEEEEGETAEEMLARMEREWFEAMVRARYEGEYAMRWKVGRG